MSFVEALPPFLADFGRACTLDGGNVTAIVDVQTIEDLDTGALTQAQSALLTASEAVGAAAGQVFVSDGITYTVRQVLKEPPDGAFVRLVLARS